MTKDTYPVKRSNVPVASDMEVDDDSRESGPDRGGNVDKIRDILFGNQMRDYDKKFSRFEERLLKETSDLREDVKRRFAAIEAFIKNELTSLSDRQKADQAANGEAVKELTRDLKETAKATEKKSGQLEEQNAKAQRDLRQQLLEESKRLTEEIEQKNRDLAVLWERDSRDLRANMADRQSLAELFAEVALRLKNGSGASEKR